MLSLGWIGSAKHWSRYETVSLILAGVSTPLVLSVHTIVSMDFATSVIPGWHTTIFPPYFVAGAIFSGFAMVLTLMIITRKTFKLEDYITLEHIESMNKVIILTGSIVGVAYITEFFIAWYSGVEYEQYAFINRATGPYWWAYWSMMTCNVITPQLFWFRSIRRSLTATFHHFDLREYWYVVRAFRNYRNLAAPRLPAIELGHVLSNHYRYRNLCWYIRFILYPVPVIC